MRKLLIGALTGTMMLVIAAIAFADTETTYEQKFTKSKANTSVGTAFETTSIDTANTANNQQPAAVRQFDIKFPAGTKIDQKAKPFCKTLDESADEPCPRNTKIGDGNAEVRLKFNGTAPIPADVTAYNRKGGLYLYIVPQVQGQAPVVLQPQFKGLNLRTKVPQLCVPPGQPPSCGEGGEAILTRFELKTDPAKKGKRRFLKTPAKCTKAGWLFKANLTYADGSKKSFESLQKCSKR